MRFISLLTVTALALSFVVDAKDYNTKPSRQQMLADLDFLETTFDVQYAPKQWKNDQFQWDLSNQIYIAKEKIRYNPSITVKDYQRILKSFLAATSDFHVSARFYSTEYASLPFQILGAQGRYFVCHVESVNEPIQVGDELLTFNNLPVGQVIEELAKQEFSADGCPSAKALAELMLTHRSGEAGHIVPQGKASVTIKHQKSGVIKTYDIAWNYSPEQVINPIVDAAAALMRSTSPASKNSKSIADHPLLNKPMEAFAAEFKNHRGVKADQDNPFDLGQRESFIPTLGKKLWDSGKESFFQAYIYQGSQNKRIGYIRIPIYVPADIEKAVAEFPEIITRMQRNTDALVIDQIHNPGGIVFYLYYLASHLSDKPLKTPPHRWTITQQEMIEALQTLPILNSIQSDTDAQSILGSNLFGYPVNTQLIQSLQTYFQFAIDEWTAGRTFTNPYPFLGIDSIQPARVRYTKPILVVVDQLCFSGGDFFPAILQDNGVAKIFGTRTAGAGGVVTNIKYPNLMGVEMVRYTASIAERKDNKPIENLGVTPDISYELTPEDLQNGFKGYIQAINASVESLLKN